MTKSELFNSAIKIFGLYYFVRFVQHFLEFLYVVLGSSYLDNGQGLFVYAGISLTFLVDVSFAYLAVFRTELISNKISSSKEGTIEVQFTKTDLLEIALAIISVVAIVNSIPNLLTQQVNSIYYHDHKEVVFWTAAAKNLLFQNLFILATGLFLLLNTRNFAKWITKRGELDDKYDHK